MYQGHFNIVTRCSFVVLVCLFVVGSVYPLVVQAQDSQNSKKEPAFFSMLQDIPLMPGLEELVDGTVSFDKPEGRIIESSALMHDLTKQEVFYFYQVTLPQFGWGKVESNRYYRQKEYLEISFDDNEGVHMVKIMIKPMR